MERNPFVCQNSTKLILCCRPHSVEHASLYSSTKSGQNIYNEEKNEGVENICLGFLFSVFLFSFFIFLSLRIVQMTRNKKNPIKSN